MKKRSGRKSANPDPKTLSGRIVLARQRLDWTQEDLGKHAGMTADAIAKIENGSVRQPRSIEAIAKALGESASWLLFGSREKGEPDIDTDKLTLIITEVRVFAEKKRLDLTPKTEAAMVVALYRATADGALPLSDSLVAAILGAIESASK